MAQGQGQLTRTTRLPESGATTAKRDNNGLIPLLSPRPHLPGLKVNLSRSGSSLSVGVCGAHVTVGKRGVTRTLGIPGSGIFYTSRTGYHSGLHSAHREPPALIGQVAAPRRVSEWVLAAIVLALVIVGLSMLVPR